ncbi:MAG: Glu-tRNA(Gln) amidotransferase subunit GatD, partial [Candidatus Brocadiia bacterium]
NLTTRKIFGIFSEDMSSNEWKTIATEIGNEIEKGCDGIVIGHGTDTMHYTAAILTFMCQNLPCPVVIVGSQRSSDRPSSDAALNLTNAVKTAAESDFAEVMVCMFGPTSDEYCLLHRGTRVRKMHSSYRSTFRTIGDTPLAMVSPKWIKPIHRDYRVRDKSRKPIIKPVFEDRVSMLYYYPNMSPDLVDSLRDNGYKGLVIIGTGLGHVNRKMNPALKRAVDSGMHVYMCVQTLWGYVQMFVYDTGRDLLELGVVPLGNMIPETSFAKLGWALGQSSDREEVKKIMLTPVGHDITEGEPSNGYLIFQGGTPDIEEFLKHIKF